MSSEGAQLYYGSKVSLQSSHGMWLTVRNKSVYLSPEELPGSALTLLNLKDPYSAGPVRYTDTILLQVHGCTCGYVGIVRTVCARTQPAVTFWLHVQANNEFLLGTRLRVDRETSRAAYELECVGERGATHVGRWDLLHPEHLHAPITDIKVYHSSKV